MARHKRCEATFPDLDEQKYYIRTTLKDLSNISTSIRKSGTKFRHQRVDRMLERRAPKLEEFRRYMFWIILVGPTKMQLLNSLLQRHTLTSDIIWKKAWITLRAYFTDEQRLSPVQKRLIHANLVRRNRFDVYFRMFCQKTEGDKGVAETGKTPIQHAAVPPRQTSTKKPDSVPDQAGHHDPAPRTQPTPSQAAESVERTVLSSQPATGIGSFVMPKRPPTQGTRSVSTKFSRGALEQDYPKCPGAEGGAFWCLFCAQPLDGSYSDRKRNKRWRYVWFILSLSDTYLIASSGHVAEDLSPYVCIYEECDSPDSMHLSTDQWKTHLKSSHSVPRWFCDSCWLDSDNPDEFEFDDEKDWTAHMLTAHDGELEEDDLGDLAETSHRSVIPPVSCPLCYGSSPPLNPGTDGHIAEHLHSFALQALPWETVGPVDETRVSVGSAIRSHSYSASDDESEGSEEGADTRLGEHNHSQLLKLRGMSALEHAEELATDPRLGENLQGMMVDLVRELLVTYEVEAEALPSYSEDATRAIITRLENIECILERLRNGIDFMDSDALEYAAYELSEETSGLKALLPPTDQASMAPSIITYDKDALEDVPPFLVLQEMPSA
ncbi:hypothetical protein PG994_005194 [Apiospora phragmitis]|uniref:Clr5 domain-containing protein n=1 Tax=Apiospora phragmitis TaxID=2905665 RepID=A0ABR1VSQ7_9PEZI